jgi:uncharacterized protein (DUF697 family)
MGQTQQEISDRIIRDHVVWSMAAGLVPIPVADMAAVSAVQLDMLSRLATTYGVRFSLLDAKAILSALVGGGAARIGANLLKLIPGAGTVIGGMSMSIASGASTYAVGQVAMNQFASGKDLGSLSIEKAREMYEQAFKKGEQVAKDMSDDVEEVDVFAKIERLGALRDQGLLTEDEFKLQKQKLLERV